MGGSRSESSARARRFDVMADLVRESAVPMALLDRDVRYVATSRRWTELHALGHADLTGLCPYDLEPPVPDHWRDAHRRGLAGEHVREREDIFDVGDGTQRWIDWSIAPWRDETSAVAGIVVTVEDITERKQAERTLRESEARYHALVDGSPDPIFVSVDQRIVYANDAAARIYGARTPAELLGLSIYEITDSSFHAVASERQLAHARNERLPPVVVRTRPLSGDPRELEFSAIATTWGGRAAVYGLGRDVTETRRLARERDESEARYRTLVEGSVDAIFVHVDLRLVYVNTAAQRLFGAPASALLGRDVKELLAPEHHADAERRRTAFARGEAIPPFLVTTNPISGEPRQVEIRATRATFEGRSAIQVVGRDVTEERFLMRERAASKARFSELADNIDSVFTLTSGDGRRILYLSPAFETVFGLSREQVMADRSLWDALTHPGDRAARPSEASPSHAGDHEYRITRPDGALRWIRARVRPIMGEGDEMSRVASVIEDITDRKAAELALRESEERYRRLVEASPDAIFVHQSRRIVYANAATARLFGVSDVGQLLGRLVWDFLDPSIHALVAPRLDALDQSGTVGPRFPIKTRTLNGEVREVEVSAIASVYDGRPAIQAMMRDVTDERRNARAARENEVRLAAIVSSAMDAIVSADDSLSIVFANPAAEELFGFPPGGLLGTSIDQLLPEGLRIRHTEAMRRFAAAQGQRGRMGSATVRGRHADGSEIPIEASIAKSELDGHTLFTAMLHDLRPRLAIEAAARESDERFRELVEQIDQVFSLTSADRKQVLYLSPAFERVFGVSRERALTIPETWASLIHPDDRAEVQGRFSLREPHEHEYRIVRPDGAVRRIRARIRPLTDRDAKVTRVIGVSEDVTERRDLEAQLQQSQKLDSIGRLAGGVAHDFNNLLTVIVGAGELLHAEAGISSDGLALVADMEEAGRRGAALTRQLLSFSRQDFLEPRVLDLGDLVDESLRLLRRLIQENIQLTHVRRDPARVRVDPGQWGQVLVNLVVNARDAMPGGGLLRVETSSLVLTTEDTRFPDTPPGAYGLLAVKDTGTGMSPEVQARIFEPFFTTKTRQQGTGLGLSVVYGIVKQADGYIHVRSEPGQGTTFSLLLPLNHQHVSPETATQRPQALAAGVETILVVEDDEAVRRMTTRILGQGGYTVLTASDGEAALAMLRERVVDLVVSDVVMPILDGASLVRVIKARWPRCKVMLCTGYADGSVVEDLRAHPLLRKPYSQHELLQKVREVLLG
ncbi:MAG: PAS domain S-box protein [Polyangiaceae bacterium]